jgi:hypothetical protein
MNYKKIILYAFSLTLLASDNIKAAEYNNRTSNALELTAVAFMTAYTTEHNIRISNYDIATGVFKTGYMTGLFMPVLGLFAIPFLFDDPKAHQNPNLVTYSYVAGHLSGIATWVGACVTVEIFLNK